MMMKIRTALITALLALLPALPVRAQAQVTVTFRLTLAGSVGPEAGFSVLYYIGAFRTPTEAVFCGQALLLGHPAGSPCREQHAVYTQRITVPAGTRLYFDIAQSHPTYELILSGNATPYKDTTIEATYPHAASAVPVTFQLAVQTKPQLMLPRGVYFAVAYPYEGQHRQGMLYGDLPLCSTVAKPMDRAYAKRCLLNSRISSATIFLPPGTAGRYVFYAFQWGNPPCLMSLPGEVNVANAPKLVRMGVKYVMTGGTAACGKPPIVGGGGLAFD
jgi:hypothetical protein